VSWPSVACRELFRAHYGKALKVADRKQSGNVIVYGSSGAIGKHTDALIERPTIVIGRKGSVGDIVYVDHPSWTIDTAYYAEILDANRCDLRYLFYALGNANLSNLTITTSIPGLNRDDLYNTKIPLPPLDEQKRIAAILDKADGLRRKREKAIALTDDLLRSVFLDMFGCVGEEWRETPFVDVALKTRNSFVNGPFGSNLLTSELRTEGVPVFYIKDVRNGRFERKSARHVTPEKARQLSSCNVMSGDVLVAKVGDPPGAAAVYPDGEPDGIVTQDVVRIRPDPNVCTPEFIVGFMNSNIGQEWLAPIIVEATRSRFGLGEIKRKTFSCPPLEEQLRYSKIKIFLENSRDKQVGVLREAQNLFDSLSHRAFSGNLTVKNKEAA
jgi:type I restriction enzyme, S subunit